MPHGEIDGLEKGQAPGEVASSQSGLEEQTAKNSFETVNEAFERGKTEGINEGRLAAIAETKETAMADAKEELADVVDTFNKVLDSLTRPKAMQIEALSSSINSTILKLASERAGMQIDELPEGFSDRINALVNSTGKELAGGKVHLNEDDYATMKPYLTNLGFQVVANANLMRGDVTIQFDGVEVHDVAANRMSGYGAVKSDNASTDNTVTDNNTAADRNTTADDKSGIANMLTGDEMLPPSDEPGS